MRDKMYAADLMTRQVQTVPATGRLRDAIAMMDAGDYHQVPVMEGDRPVRLLTERDVRRAICGTGAESPVGELASPLPCLLQPEAPLSEVLQALRTEDSLLVVGADGHLAGIITYWDVLKVARPHLLVAEAELLLRKAVAKEYSAKYGPDWWSFIPPDLRNRAEEEHRRDADEGDHSSEHKLGHTSFWSLIEIYRTIRPELPEERIRALHKVREWRNQVAHLYVLSEAELAALVADTLAMRDFLEAPPAPACPA